MDDLTEKQVTAMNELIKTMWSTDACEAFLDNADIWIKLNEWIGIALLNRQYQLYSSLVQAVFALGYKAGKDGQLDGNVWGDAINDIFTSETGTNESSASN